MGLSSDLISKFVKATNDTKDEKKETLVYGEVVEYNGEKYVRLDGSELLTPVTSTADAKVGERVTVLIKNHTATVTGNISSPSARTGDVRELGSKITEFEIVIADKVSTQELEAEKARIDDLTADNVLIKEQLVAAEASIGDLEADNVTIKEKLTANEADISSLKTGKLDATAADIKYATIESLNATDANIRSLEATYGDFKDLTTEKFTATNAAIENLETKKLDAESAKILYANIDFSNIGEAAIEYLYSTSGLIRNVIISEGSITGELVGVTIKGDLIEGGTVKADKLVIKGEDGLYYKLNTDGVTTEAEQTEYNSLDGSHIIAKSITATKIAVDDLVAFDATIGGFNITESSIYSGVKSSVNNTTRGIYLDKNGQVAFGDETNFFKYYRDSDGTYKLEISAGTIKMSSSNKTVEEVVGKAIVKSEEQFYQSTSPTSLSGGSWSTSQPTWTEGTYIWRRTLVTYGDGSTSHTPSQNGVCITGNTGSQGIQGEKGETGATGAKGETGNGISKTEVFYYLSTSNTTQTGGSWSTTVPTWMDGRYYWQKIKSTFTDGTSSESTPVCITGAKGETGSSGAKGDAGATGTGVESITTEFYLSTSKTSQTEGSWVTTMPTWSSGKYLWTRNKIVYKNPTSTVYTTPICDSSWEAVNEIEIGGRNYILASKFDMETDKWTKNSVTTSFENGYLELSKEATSAIAFYYQNNYDTAMPQEGESYTISLEVMKIADVNIPSSSQIFARYIHSSKENSELTANIPTNLEEGVWTKISSSFTYEKDYAPERIQIAIVLGTSAGGFACRNFKFEKGNRATDWTPAPEDVDQKIDDTSNEIHKTIVEQNTEITKNAEKIILEALKSYVTTGDYEEYKSTISTQLELMAGQINLNFTTLSEELTTVDGETQKKFTEIYRYISFDNGNIVLGSSENAITLTIENDMIVFKKNGEQFGWWDGNDFHTGNIVVELDERAQFGNFAFIPRSDGSLSFLKVGD